MVGRFWSHIVSFLHLGSFRVLKRRNNVVDIEVHFDKLRLRLERCPCGRRDI